MKYYLFLLLFLTSCSEEPYKVPLVKVEDLQEVCLNGHLYYQNSQRMMNNFALAPILNNDGTPVYCQ